MSNIVQTTVFYTLYFNSEAEQAVSTFWQEVASTGMEVAGLNGHRPHITVASYDVDQPDDEVARLDQFAAGMVRFPIKLGHIGIFPEKGVIFLAPYLSSNLFNLHRRLLAHLGGTNRPPIKFGNLALDHWVPHCTIAVGVQPEQMGTAVSYCQRNWRLIEGVVEGIGMLIPPAIVDAHQFSFSEPTLDLSTLL